MLLRRIALLHLLGILCLVSPTSSFSFAETDSKLSPHLLSKRQAPTFPNSIFFKYRWASQCGYGATFNPDELSIQVSSTLSVPNDILDKAARLVHLVTRFMPRPLFRSLSHNISVGVFVYRQDQPSIFPEYSDRADTPKCAGQCQGECAQTCLEDGTKFDNQWYYSGPRILVSSQNLNCDRNLFDDPQFGLLNLLVAEISKVTVTHMSSAVSQTLYQSFQNAIDTNLWLSSTAMSSAPDYFIQGSLSWFTSTRLTDLTTGGMNFCGEQACPTEMESRKRIADLDPGLYRVLNEIYNNGRQYIKGGITVCRW